MKIDIDNGILTISRDDYGMVNEMFCLVDDLRICNLKKHGNTCIGIDKIDALIKLMKEEKIEFFHDETADIFEIADEENLLKELGIIIGYITGVDVRVFKSWYDRENLCPGDRDHIYLVWSTEDRYSIRNALHTNELIYEKNRRMRHRKRENKNITIPYKLTW